MEVILLERIEKLGELGDVVRVKDGYARNYLLPSSKALRATKEAHAIFKAEREKIETENQAKKTDASTLATRMAGLEVVMVEQAGEGGQLYGSVSARDIAKSVSESGFSVKRNQIIIDKPIKALGMYKAQVKLHAEVPVEITVNVARSDEEAKLQAAGLEVGLDATEEIEEAPSNEEVFDKVDPDVAISEETDAVLEEVTERTGDGEETEGDGTGTS